VNTHLYQKIHRDAALNSKDREGRVFFVAGMLSCQPTKVRTPKLLLVPFAAKLVCIPTTAANGINSKESAFYFLFFENG